jgi:hypothetical protein
MKSVILWTVVLLSAVAHTYAIEVSLGPTLAVKGTVNTVAPGTGLKTGFALNNMPDIGLTTRLMPAKDLGIGFLLDIESTGYGYIVRPENEDFANDSNTYLTRHSYITIAPSLYLGGLTLGVGIMLPTNRTTATVSGNELIGGFIGEQQASPALEVRLGAMIPVIRSKFGDLTFNIRGTYMLDGHFTTEVPSYPGTFLTTSNPQSASLSLGLTYLFHVVD